MDPWVGGGAMGESHQPIYITILLLILCSWLGCYPWQPSCLLNTYGDLSLPPLYGAWLLAFYAIFVTLSAVLFQLTAVKLRSLDWGELLVPWIMTYIQCQDNMSVGSLLCNDSPSVTHCMILTLISSVSACVKTFLFSLDFLHWECLGLGRTVRCDVKIHKK